MGDEQLRRGLLGGIELADAGVRMANEPAKGKRTVKDPTAKAGAAKVTRRAKTGSTATQNDADTESAPQASTARLIEQLVAQRWGTPTMEDADSGNDQI